MNKVENSGVLMLSNTSRARVGNEKKKITV